MPLNQPTNVLLDTPVSAAPTSPAIRLRPAAESDVAFIFNSWLKSYKGSEHGKQIAPAVFFNAHHKLVEGLFVRTQMTIACLPDDPSQILGYICHEQIDGVLVVHFIYVKDAFRGLGVAGELLKTAGAEPGKSFCYTHKTHAAAKYERTHPIVYHPYLAYSAYQPGNADE